MEGAYLTGCCEIQSGTEKIECRAWHTVRASKKGNYSFTYQELHVLGPVSVPVALTLTFLPVPSFC